MIKIDLVTGFLGSGKTTFISRYVRYLTGKGEKIAILENDYGAVNVDALLLDELEGDNCEIQTVAGGCDRDCHVRRFRTKLIAMGMRGFDRVVVEPSGIYDVDEFFDVLYEEPLDQWYETGSIITILDSRLDSSFSKEARYFLLSQTAQAGMILLSHMTGDAAAKEKSAADFLNEIMEEFGCDRRFSIGDVLAKAWETLTDEDYEQISSCGYHLADHVKLPLLDNNGFATLYFLNLNLSIADLKTKAAEMMQDPSLGQILRIKGFHNENGQWFELNASRDSLTVKQCRTGQEVFIIIGEHLMQEEISRRIGVSEEVWHNGQVYAK